MRKLRGVRAGITVAALLVAMLVLAGPAFAHHSSDHDGGQGTRQQETKGDEAGKADAKQSKDNDGDADNRAGQTTEDNDDDNQDGWAAGAGDRPNNEPDAGDNQHPSGRDKSVEHDKGNQGNSESNPDNDGRGPDRHSCGANYAGPCIDKPGGDGGEDVYDQDGNNGCGNDDDFEDDNEGLCLGRKKKDAPQTGTEIDTVVVTPPAPDDEVKSDDVERDEDFVKPEDEVLGERVDHAVAAAPSGRERVNVLPFTGVAIAIWLVAAGALVVIGTGLLKVRRN